MVLRRFEEMSTWLGVKQNRLALRAGRWASLPFLGPPQKKQIVHRG